MPPFSPKPYNANAAQELCAKLSLRDLKTGQMFNLSLSKALQEDLFGAPLDDDDGLELMLSTDPGKTHILGLRKVAASSANALTFARGPHDSVQLRLQPWTQVAPGKRPPAQMPIVARPEKDGAMFRLPEWARPAEGKRG